MGQLMGIVGPILLLGGAIYVFSKRCELLGICGSTPADSGVIPEASAATEEVVTDTNTPVTPDTTSASKAGCCECGMQGDRVKCRQNGGAWFNPPAGEGGSNDQSVALSLQECLKSCSGGSGTGSSSSSKNSTTAKTGSQGNPGSTTKGVQNKNNSVTGSGQKINPPAKTSSGAPNPYKSYVNANPKGYKPGGGTYYTTQQRRSYFVDPNYVRPFTLYHRIGNIR
jgi:hypothetical protein